MSCCGIKCGLFDLKVWCFMDFLFNVIFFGHGLYEDVWHLFTGWCFFVGICNLLLFFYFAIELFDELNCIRKIWTFIMVIHVTILISMWVYYPYTAFHIMRRKVELECNGTSVLLTCTGLSKTKCTFEFYDGLFKGYIKYIKAFFFKKRK